MDIYLFELDHEAPFRNPLFHIKPVNYVFEMGGECKIIDNPNKMAFIPEGDYSCVIVFENQLGEYRYTYHILPSCYTELYDGGISIKARYFTANLFDGLLNGVVVVSNIAYDPFNQVTLLLEKGKAR